MVVQKNSWDPTHATSVQVFASAGLTPGTGTFAAYYESVIAAGDISYSSIVNSLDIVPNGWEGTDLETIPSIYNSYITVPSGTTPPNEFMGIMLCGLQYLAVKAGSFFNPYKQVSTNRNILPGTFDTTVDTAVQTTFKDFNLIMPTTLQQYVPYVINLARFAAQAVAQHTTQYQVLTKVTAFNTAYQAILATNKPAIAVQSDPFEAAVKKHTGISMLELSGMVAKKTEQKEAVES
jgi:hypothetical protein